MISATRQALHHTPSLHLPTTAPTGKVLATAGPYRALLAATEEERTAIYRLRFRVFNLELKEGLDAAYESGEDRDKFDDVCEHLYLHNSETGEVVGTYRLQTGATAARNLGYYSEQEFQFGPYEHLRNEVVELGRACIEREHRSFESLNLLWRAVAAFAETVNGRYLIGCSSLTSQDPAEGWSVYDLLQSFLVESKLRTSPQPEVRLPQTEERIAARAPRLLRAYLSVGAKICGAPALDREFKTIDFLTLLDLQRITASARARFLK